MLFVSRLLPPPPTPNGDVCDVVDVIPVLALAPACDCVALLCGGDNNTDDPLFNVSTSNEKYAQRYQ